jgi:phosphatidylglycerophosphatase A
MAPWEIALVAGTVCVLLVGSLNQRGVLRQTGETRGAFLLWLAQGFGVGRIPLAPGTFGSLVGVLWFLLLLLAGNLWVFLGGALIGVAVSVWACGRGEQILRQKDPGSIVLDEIAAVPVCFLGWLAIVFWKTGAVPPPEYFFEKPHWPLTLGIFVAFRFFDVLKPWPVRGSQSLAGGWGVTMDDVLAAVYVNLMVLAAYGARAALG